MAHLIKVKKRSFLKWMSFNLTENNFRPSEISIWTTGSYRIAQNPRFYRTKGALNRNARITREAQNALIDYFHSTRNLQYMDAELICQNSPRFLEKLLKEVENENNVKRSMTRFLRYHPINEFVPFFESMGLSPSEYSSFLPRDLMFLSDDQVLLDNYHVLWEWGITMNTIGRIYKKANEVFRYDCGGLDSKMRSFKEMGFDQTSIVKVVAVCPHLLIGDTVQEFFKVLERLKSSGVVLEWIVEQLSEEESYNWRHILEIFCLFSELGCSDEQLGGLLRKHPAILLEDSGSTTILLIGFLLKFGASADEVISMFMKLPQIQFRTFFSNLSRCYRFFVEIEMKFQDIAKLVCAYPILLGSCSLKSSSTILCCLYTKKKRLCKIIKENPQVLTNWVRGSRVKQLPSSVEDDMLEKTKFLLYFGFVENSSQMKKALRVFRGRGGELQERYDCLVNVGLSKKDIKGMLMTAPAIINQTKELIEMKIDCLLSLGYPISSVVAYPASLVFAIQRVKHRVLMYNWLKDQGTMPGNLSLCTLIGKPDSVFITKKVNSHPNGPEVWEKLKKQIYSE